MTDNRYIHKNVKAYPLHNSGGFTWNTKTRTMTFMRAGNPESDREEMQKGSYFLVQGNDIKHLYQILHEYYSSPKKKPVRNWSDHAEKPPEPHSMTVDGHIKPVLEPHKNWKKIRND